MISKAVKMSPGEWLLAHCGLFLMVQIVLEYTVISADLIQAI